MIKITLTLLLICINLIDQTAYCQKINTSGLSTPVLLEKKIGSIFKDNSRLLNEKEIGIANEMTRLKEHYKKEDIMKISRMQNELDGRSGSANTVQTINLISPDANYIASDPQQTDQLTLSEIYSVSSAYIKAIATQVEQRNPGAGTIWIVIAVGAGDVGVGATPDTLLFFNSTNNGISFSLIKRTALNTGMKINYNEMDLEIIEPFTNEKYLQVVISVITDGFTGIHTAGIITLKKSDLTLSGGPSFSFPGVNYNVSKYSKARITSDNAKYPAEAYITISVIQDSTDGINNFIMTKICKIFNPYALITSHSQITYLSQSIHTPVNGYSTAAQTDVAYYNSGGTVQGDSILFVQSGFPGSETYINIYKNYGNTLVYPTYSGSLSGNSYIKEYARIASNGGADQKSIYIVYVEKDNFMGNYYYSLDAFKTSNGINWSNTQLAGGGDANSEIKDPDIIGRRETNGKFYITNKWVTPRKDIISSFVIENNNLKYITSDNNDQINGSFASPKPSFRFLNNDSCLTVWPLYSGVYATCGCKSISLSLGFIIEGLYYSSNDSAGIDISDIHLRSALPPYNIISTASGYNLSLLTFPDALAGYYYISVNHRNSIETWYYTALNLNDSLINSINFYSYQFKAYGNNQKKVDSSPDLYAIYSGDVNQDGAINLTDVIGIFNAANNFTTGYVVTDLNGDQVVNLTDLIIAYNNSINFVSVIKP